MKTFIEVSNDGSILQISCGFEDCPFENGVEIDVDSEFLNEIQNYKYINGEFVKNKPEEKTPSELRQNAYANVKIIEWFDKLISVDEANKLYLDYFAEANPKADQIQPLIIEAKAYIRSLYPDPVV